MSEKKLKAQLARIKMATNAVLTRWNKMTPAEKSEAEARNEKVLKRKKITNRKENI